MKIGLIGCGKVGTTLFYFLKKNNQITGVYDTNKRNEKKTLRILGIQRNPQFKDLCAKSEVLFFAAPDDQLVKAYKKAKSFIRGRKYVFHFSGLLPAEIFRKSKNVYRASIHPFATFPKIIIPPTRKRYYLFVEGDSEAKKVAQKIFQKKYFSIRNISKKQKVIHHLLGVFSSNLVVGLIATIDELLKNVGWKRKDFYEVVFPLIEETLNNIKKYKIKNALSGPLQRGDIEVIRKHLKALKDDKNLLNIYKGLSLKILEDIVRGKKKKEIEKILKG